MSEFLFYTFRIIIISFRYKRREIMKRTYPSWIEGQLNSKQTEYTAPTKLLGDDGKLLAPGWARHNVFEYEREKAKPANRKKEWDFYQISNGEFMVQISFANISLTTPIIDNPFVRCAPQSAEMLRGCLPHNFSV